MVRTSMIAATAAAAFIASGPASAQRAPHGAAAEARAMPDRAVAAVRADKLKALEAFDAGADGSRDRDLDPFRVDGRTGIYSAHPAPRGKRVLDPNHDAGHAHGRAIPRVGDAEGTVGEVTHSFPRPSGGGPVPKATSVTEIGDRVCGVGYHRWAGDDAEPVVGRAG